MLKSMISSKLSNLYKVGSTCRVLKLRTHSDARIERTYDLFPEPLKQCSWLHDGLMDWLKDHPSNKRALIERLDREIDTFSKLDAVVRMPILTDHMKDLLHYNINDDKLLRGSQVMHVMKMIKRGELSTSHEEIALIGGLIAEFMRGLWNIEDDILDRSLMRYGRPCWYQLERVGVSAVNDITLMTFIMLTMIEKHFRHLSARNEIVDYMNYMNLVTAYGQYLDEALTRQSKLLPDAGGKCQVNWSVFTMDNYQTCVELKTGNFDVMSVRLGLYLCDVVDPATHAAAEAIALKVGLLDQVSDDFIDVFVDENTIGSSGTDIQEAKLSWLILTALKRANKQQRKELDEHYGRNNAASIARVKDLYLQLSLPQAYRQFQDTICTDIIQMVERWDEEKTNVPRAIFPCLFSNVYVNGSDLRL